MRTRFGKTLIEQIVVLAIIAILAAIYLPAVLNALGYSRDKADGFQQGKQEEVRRGIDERW